MMDWMAAPQALLDRATAFLAANPVACAWFTTLVRFTFPVLALLILVRTIRSLLTVPHLPEVWAYLALPNGARQPLTHWENILGRSPSCDVELRYPVVSRQHAALIRGEGDVWTAYDLASTGGLSVNGKAVEGQAPAAYGDVVSLGGVETVLLPVSPEEKAARRARRRAARPVSPWLGLLLLTALQILTAVQLVIADGEQADILVPLSFVCLTLLMWLYVLVMRALRRVGFEMETIAFFLSTLSLAVTASSNPSAVFKQLLALVLGLAVFLVLGIFLRDLTRVGKIRWLMAAAAMTLMSATLVLGVAPQYGAANWIRLGALSIQPSELAKICYIFAGAATLERLFRRRNLWLFILLTGFCLGCLALMSDFGTAAIFFVTFLVIAYLRSGTLPPWPSSAGAGCSPCSPCSPSSPISSAASPPGATPGRTPRWAAATSRPAPCPPPPPAGWWGWAPGRAGSTGWPPGTPIWCSACCARSGGSSSPCWRCWPLLPWRCSPCAPAGRPLQLLHHRRLRRHLHDGLPDLSERIWRGGYPAADRGDLPLRVQRRVGHGGLLGPAGLPQGHRHPTERQLCHPPAQPAGGGPGCPACPPDDPGGAGGGAEP